MRTVLIGIALILTVGVAQSAEPTAEELLRRSKTGKSILPEDDSVAVTRAPNGRAVARGTVKRAGAAPGERKTPENCVAITFGASRVLFEGAVYFDGNGTRGIFVGNGYGWVSESYGSGTASYYHAGFAQKINPQTSFGLGMSYNTATASVGRYSADAASIGLSAWLEWGQERGPAVRAQIGVEGLTGGVGVRW